MDADLDLGQRTHCNAEFIQEKAVDKSATLDCQTYDTGASCVVKKKLSTKWKILNGGEVHCVVKNEGQAFKFR